MKKKVISYARISTEDQSNWSISGQMQEHQDFCTRKEYELLKTFVDEGQSAKSFDRQAWRELEEYIQANRGIIDYIIVSKYDRFSRNLREALNTIHDIEEHLKIKIVSVREDIGVNPESPFYFKWRTDLLSSAHFERMVIVERTIHGIRSGKRAGRFLGKAPFGYKNERDVKNLPIITINPQEAEVVRYVYTAFLMHKMTYADIRRGIKERFDIDFYKERIFRILNNPTYAGLIFVREHSGHPEQLVPGLHKAIIDADDYYHAQALIQREGAKHYSNNPTAFLKSVLSCDICYNLMTSCRSKGKTKHYWYYECPKHRKSFNVDNAHETLYNILEQLSLTPVQLDYLQGKVLLGLKDKLAKQTLSINFYQKKLEELNRKEEILNDKYIETASIDTATYSHYKAKYANERKEYTKKLEGLMLTESHYMNKYESMLPHLGNLKHIFTKAKVEDKQALISSVFGRTFTYNGTTYRTLFLHPIFKPKALLLKDYGLLTEIKKGQVLTLDPLGDDNAPSTEPLLELLTLLNSIA